MEQELQPESKEKSQSESKWVTIVKIICAIILPNLGGMFGAIFSIRRVDNWYPTLEKPSWTPPNWVFAPMWIFLYCLIGTASYLVYRFGGGVKGKSKWCLVIYLVNLVLNWSWTPVFFNGQEILGGFILIIFVLLTAVIVAVAFGLVSRIAGVLILPYIVWLVIATSLNGWIYVNNPKNE